MTEPDDEAIGEAVDRLAAEHDHVTGKRPLARKSPDFEAEAAYWLRYYYLYSLSRASGLAALLRRMYEAGRGESGTLLDLSELEDQLKRARARREKLLALADRWERDAKTGTFYATREGADDVRLTLLRCARELRTLLQSPESDSD